MQVFVLYAFNGKVMVPVARVLIANEDVKFFKKNRVLSKSPANWMVEWVVKRIKKECPCILRPFEDVNFWYP
jgi:hypothetical protein